ncbi:MAG: BsuBI/PstI family type II restriction endonuclease [Gaiellales bacterium]
MGRVVTPVGLSGIQERLRLIFPAGVPGRERLVRELAARTIAVFLFVDAIGDPDEEGARLMRPSMVTWMTDGAFAETDPAFRTAWRTAAAVSNDRVRSLLTERGLDDARWYAENTREPIRDEIIRPLEREFGAVRRRRDLSPTSSSPALTLARDFADLFDDGLLDDGLLGEPLTAAIAGWQGAHLGPAAKARMRALERLDAASGAVRVLLPGRGERQLPAGASSVLTARVIEDLAPRLLAQPYVLAVCHSRDPIAAEDAAELAAVRLTLDSSVALPDIVLLDAGAGGSIWFVEVVVSDGPVNETRRAELLGWALGRGLDPASCRFVTAYRSRSDPVFRRSVGELAWGSLAWFADEPGHALELRELA